VRHIRLKSSHRQSASAAVNAHIGLERKPSACIIWISFDRNTMELGQFLWFGPKPGRPAPAFGDRLAKHVRANHTGFKGFRPNLSDQQKPFPGTIDYRSGCSRVIRNHDIIPDAISASARSDLGLQWTRKAEPQGPPRPGAPLRVRAPLGGSSTAPTCPMPIPATTSRPSAPHRLQLIVATTNNLLGSRKVR